MQRIFVIAGPSNTGKDTIMRRLLQIPELNLVKVVTSTSRPPRPDEIDGIDYHFYTKDEFIKKIENGDFFEWALVHTDYKGIQKSSIYNDIPKDKDIIIQVDIQGYKSLQSTLDFSKYKLIGIFISPPSMDELQKRMKLRGTETNPEDIRIRLKNAEFEMANKDVFDYQVVNDNLEKCTLEVIDIIKKNQL
ncbi:MAG: guanylate kinase [Alphaproteobacteria bacterium]|nr:guanylate kinase [Alphaproteobacteria bacterium]